MTEQTKKWYRQNISITEGEMRALWEIGLQLMKSKAGAPPSISRIIRLCIIEAAAARGIRMEENQ